MKLSYKYLIAGMIAFSITACNDSFLERIPTNDLNDLAFWKTTSDLETYCNGIYNEASYNNSTSQASYRFLIGFNSGAWDACVVGPYTMDAMSDNFATMDPNGIWASSVAAGIENIPGGEYDCKYAGWHWTLLRRINVFMANYDKVQADESAKLPYVGEALFFRAWFYLYMVQYYGDVPLITTPLETNSPELTAARTPRKEVMVQVLKDINNACNYLPAENWGDNRLTKGAALALKSRIGLYEYTYRKYHPEMSLGDGKEFLDACIDACEQLMNMGYEIYNTGSPEQDYRTLFTTEDLSTNKEVIFYRKYAENLKRHRICGYTVNMRHGGTKDLIDDYLCIDNDGKARPVSLSQDYNNDTPEQEFKNRDYRLSQTFLEPGTEPAKRIFEKSSLALVSYPRIGDMKTSPSLTGYQPIKYYIYEQDQKGFDKETHDFPIFRYAEVLLNYAEAKAELGECTQQILNKTVNLLRRRAGLPDLQENPEYTDPKYTKYGLPSLLIEIRRERRVEFALEYLRYQDLMRWGWGERLAEPVLGMRLEDSDFSNPRYDGAITKAEDPNHGNNAIYRVEINGKHYIDAYGGTNYASERRSFDPTKDYLRPIPGSAISANPKLGQNPRW